MLHEPSILLFSCSRKFPAYGLAQYLSESFHVNMQELGSGHTLCDKKASKLSVDFVQELVTKYQAIMVVFDYARGSWSERQRIKLFLDAFRELRVPYIACPRDSECKYPLLKIMIPVGFLPEEKEKAPWGSSFAKHCGADLFILQPLDRGTRAEKNVAFIANVLDSYKRKYTILKGTKNSFYVEKEAVVRYAASYDLFFITASRAYGLDDMFFGPKEYHILKKTQRPVLIINPRDDIYVLCGD